MFLKHTVIIEYDSKYMSRQTGRTNLCLDIRVVVTYESEHEGLLGKGGLHCS